MKITLTTILLFLAAHFSFAQDTITKTDGEKIEGKVIEITSSTIKYTRKSQPDGPIRNIELTEIQLIEYADGTKERFVQVESKPSNETVIVESIPSNMINRVRRPGPDLIPSDKDRILQSGMFVDLMAGYANYSGSNSFFNQNFGGVQLRLGNKWYFGKGEKYRPGIQATWIRFGVFSNSISPSDISKGYFSVLNLGFTNAIKFKENRGLEVNLNAGPTILEPPIPTEQSGEFGLLYSLEVKYRLGRLALGIDATRVEEQVGSGIGIGRALSMISLSAGFKF